MKTLAIIEAPALDSRPSSAPALDSRPSSSALSTPRSSVSPRSRSARSLEITFTTEGWPVWPSDDEGDVGGQTPDLTPDKLAIAGSPESQQKGVKEFDRPAAELEFPSFNELAAATAGTSKTPKRTANANRTKESDLPKVPAFEMPPLVPVAVPQSRARKLKALAAAANETTKPSKQRKMRSPTAETKRSNQRKMLSPTDSHDAAQPQDIADPGDIIFTNPTFALTNETPRRFEITATAGAKKRMHVVSFRKNL